MNKDTVIQTIKDRNEKLMIVHETALNQLIEDLIESTKSQVLEENIKNIEYKEAEAFRKGQNDILDKLRINLDEEFKNSLEKAEYILFKKYCTKHIFADGKKITAIKEVRGITGLGLKDAKHFVEETLNI